MSDTLFDKLSLTLKGVFHDATDKMGDPGRDARQLTRDLDQAIGQAEEQIIGVRAEYNLTVSKRDTEKAEVGKYAAYATKAVQKGDDALAHEALTEKAKHAKLMEGYQTQLDAFKPSMDTLEAQMQKLRARKEQMERDTSMIEARSATAAATTKTTQILDGIGSGASASKSFDKLNDQVARQEAEARARMEMSAERNGQSLDDKFAALDSEKSSIDDELAALKASVGKKD